MYNVIIVDDEQYSYSYLKDCIGSISRSFEVTGTFKNGKDAWEYLKNNSVDVVITDIKMPVMSGLELARLIYENNMDINVVVISGYEDFEYARRAIEYNVFYYLVKTIDYDELSDVILRLKELLDKKSDKTDEYDNERERFCAESIIGCFNSRTEMMDDYKKLGFKVPFDKALCSMYSIEINGYDEFLSEKWQYGKDSFEKSISNILNSILSSSDKDIYIISFEQAKIKCIIFSDNSEDYSQYIMNSVQLIFELDMSVIRISDVKSVENLCDFESLLSDDVLLKMIASYLKIRNYEKIMNIFYRVNANKSNYSIISQKVIDNIKKVSRDASESEDNYEDKYISMAEEYMKNNYSKDISREDVASCTYFAPKYFGSMFKKKTGVTISDYLMTLRMKKAIELLSSNMKIQDIAEAVGMKSVRNFLRVFKNYTGCTPSEYRNIIYKKENPKNDRILKGK